MRSDQHYPTYPTSERDKTDDFEQQSELSFWDNPVEKISYEFSHSTYSKLIGYSIGAVIIAALALAFPINWLNLGILAATGCGVGAIDKIKNGRSFFEGFAYGVIGSIVLTSFLSIVVPHTLSALVFYGILPAPFVAPMLTAWPFIQTFLPMAILAGGAISECFKPRALADTFEFLSAAIVKLTTSITTRAEKMIRSVINSCYPSAGKSGPLGDEEKRRSLQPRPSSTATYMEQGERSISGLHPRFRTEQPLHQPAAGQQEQTTPETGFGLPREVGTGDREQPPLATGRTSPR